MAVPRPKVHTAGRRTVTAWGGARGAAALFGVAALVVPAAPAGAAVAAAPPGGVERAAAGHGTVSGRERTAGAETAVRDSDVLLAGTRTTGGDGAPGAGGGWWTVSTAAEDGARPYAVWAGRLDGTGEKQRISPDDGRHHVHPVTDGKTVVWSAYQGRWCYLLARPVDGGPVRQLDAGQGIGCAYTGLGVEGKTVTYTDVGYKSRPTRAMYLRMGEGDPVPIPPAGGGNPRTVSTSNPSLRNDRIAFDDCKYTGSTGTLCRITVLDVTTGRRTVVADAKLPAPTAITSRYVYWLETEDPGSGPGALHRVNLDGSDPVVVSPASGEDALRIDGLTASDDAVTVAARSADGTAAPETPVRLWQFSPDGSRRERVSCDGGDQVSPASAGARQVVWIDTTGGSTDLVTRTRPAGTCG
ncbi:hypothetical protein ACH4PU_32930 [Streptomyces sp. NPDC021100]|uniref:hypothetical protein n=1 Tax=Streptomyces sp. NPDC021100 TaxID=3365114 RepID=UPI00379BD535